MRIPQSLLERMNQWIDDHCERLVSELQAFGRMRSVSRGDLAVPNAPFGPEMREMLDFALMRAASYGLDARNHEGYFGSVSLGDANRVIGIFGHLDVVSEGDGWLYPPFGATRLGDFLIGRGVADNKAACVMGLFLLSLFKELGIPLRHGLRLVLGCAEETGMRDMEYFARTQVMPDVSLVPDMRFPVNYAQKGMLRADLSIIKGDGGLRAFDGGAAANMVPSNASALLDGTCGQVKEAFSRIGAGDRFSFHQRPEGVEVAARGIAAHAAYPEEGESAIHMLADAIARSATVRDESLRAMQSIARISAQYDGAHAGVACEDQETGKTTMVAGTARTRGALIHLSVDCRLSVKSELEHVERAFRAYCARHDFSIDSFDVKPPFYLPKEDPRVVCLMDVYRELTGDDTPAYAAGGGTYSRCLTGAITFGPGFPQTPPRPPFFPAGHGGAHAPDEFLHIPAMIRAMKIYAAAICALDQGEPAPK